MAVMSAITINIAEKRYASAARNGADHLALSQLKFDVPAGEFVCVLGPSGCGKTTLLNLIAGLDTAYDGEIALPPGTLEHLAYVFQTPRLLPWRTVQQNVDLVAEEQDDGAGLAARLLEAVGLGAFANSYPGELSVGMQRRAALARAFACRPELLLMDEPFVSLDPAAAEELRKLLRAILAERRATVIFVTHDHAEAVQLADRILVLSGAPAKIAAEIDVTLDAKQRFDSRALREFAETHLLARDL
ncbi:MAG: ATP-binding cassette domain-containing protein [Alphaproteobacteria bacterium]|nr:ATP-binding cassette domain-containing protein [Alphaproteobacteria bacterium]